MSEYDFIRVGTYTERFSIHFCATRIFRYATEKQNRINVKKNFEKRETYKVNKNQVKCKLCLTMMIMVCSMQTIRTMFVNARKL